MSLSIEEQRKYDLKIASRFRSGYISGNTIFKFAKSGRAAALPDLPLQMGSLRMMASAAAGFAADAQQEQQNSYRQQMPLPVTTLW